MKYQNRNRLTNLSRENFNSLIKDVVDDLDNKDC